MDGILYIVTTVMFFQINDFEELQPPISENYTCNMKFIFFKVTKKELRFIERLLIESYN